MANLYDYRRRHDPSSTEKGARRYRHYVSMDVIRNRETREEVIRSRHPAGTMETAVVNELRRVMRTPKITAQLLAHMANEGKILPPAKYSPSENRTQDPHILRAIGRAWGWGRRLKAGKFDAVAGLAKPAELTERRVSRQLRLADLAPSVLERLVSRRDVPAGIPLILTDVAARISLGYQISARTGRIQ